MFGDSFFASMYRSNMEIFKINTISNIDVFLSCFVLMEVTK